MVFIPFYFTPLVVVVSIENDVLEKFNFILGNLNAG